LREPWLGNFRAQRKCAGLRVSG